MEVHENSRPRPGNYAAWLIVACSVAVFRRISGLPRLEAPENLEGSDLKTQV